jgi:hypothetical protein
VVGHPPNSWDEGHTKVWVWDIYAISFLKIVILDEHLPEDWVMGTLFKFIGETVCKPFKWAVVWMAKDVFELGAVICKGVNDGLFLGNGAGINVEEG